MKRALVVGSRGQDGTLLSGFLASRGYSVTGLWRQGADMPGGRSAPPVDLDDPAAVDGCVQGVLPDEVYYLAAYHHSAQQAGQVGAGELWKRSLGVNAAGPALFLDSLQRHAPRARFFYAGSCLAFGEPEQSPQTERTCPRPVCPYGVSKAAGAHAVRHYRERHGLFALTGILYNHESHLRPAHFLSRKIVRGAWRIARGLDRELVLGDLDARADWGYAPDFVEAFWKTLQAPTAEDFVIATGRLRGVRDWAEKAFALAGLAWQEHVREDPSLLGRRREPLVGDPSRIREACGWRPTTDFDRMVELMFQHEGNIP